MTITAERRQELVQKFAQGANDTGSPEVQVSLLSERIANLTNHFKIHRQDDHSRRGLLRLVAQRRKLLDYLKGKSPERYQDLIKELGLRK